MKSLSLFKMIIILLTILPVPLWAQNTSVIPYTGTLYSQGKPVSQNQAIKMAFALYAFNQETLAHEVSTQFTSQTEAPSEHVVWTSWTDLSSNGELESPTEALTVDATVPVLVRNGQFLVHLGDSTQGNQPALFDSILSLYTEHRTDDGTLASRTPKVLYLVIWVKPSTTQPVKRLPPQKLNTVPHAVSASQIECRLVLLLLCHTLCTW